MMSVTIVSAQVITFYTPKTVRVQKAPGNEPPARKYDFVVKAKPETVKVKVSTHGDITTYRSSALIVNVDTRTRQVSFARPAAATECARRGRWPPTNRSMASVSCRTAR